MRSTKTTSMLLLVMLTVGGLVSCSRSPEVAKRRYLESGNKYFDRAKYKEARIMYLDAIQKDRLFGPAYYRLGLTSLKLQALAEAVGAFRRAMDLIKVDQPEHWDAMVKLSEIYLLVGRGQNQKQYLDEVRVFCDKLLKRDANSFDGHRLTADAGLCSAPHDRPSVRTGRSGSAEVSPCGASFSESITGWTGCRGPDHPT